MADRISADELWQFSLALYPKVKPACLRLQDEHGANVNLLLLLCLLEERQLSLAREQLCQLSTTLQRFSVQFTQPLRALRKQSCTAMLTTEQQQLLKQSLLQTELRLEKLEQQLLLQHCPPLTDSAAPLLELYLAQLTNDITAYQQQIFDLRQAFVSLS